MNLSTLLNDENDNVDRPPRRTSGAQSRQNPLPALRTDTYRSPGGPSSRQSSFESQNPALLQSPAIHRLTRSEHSYHNPYSPNGSVPYAQNNTPQSPYATSSISPGNPHPYASRPSSYPSIPSTPSSTQTQTPYTYHESPISNCQHPTGGVAYLNHAISQPGTPLGPPNGPFRLPSHSSRDSPANLHTLHSPTNANNGNLAGLHRSTVQSSINHIVNATSSYQQPSLRGSSHRLTRSSESEERARSVSISPKTVVNALPPHLSVVSPQSQSFSDSSSPMKDDTERQLYSASDTAQNTRQHDHYQTMPVASPSSLMSPQSAFLIDPLQLKSLYPSTPEMSRKGDILDVETPIIASKPEHDFTTSTEISPKDTTTKTSIVSRQKSSLPLESSQLKSENIPSLRFTSLKRTHEDETAKELSNISPALKRRRCTEIPIWAQRCKHTSHLPKYRVSNIANGGNHVKPTKSQMKTNAPSQNSLNSNDVLEIWEPTFTNIIPLEDTTKMLCDFLFTHVVLDETLHTKSSAEFSNPEGLLEIEAKLGTIVDKSTGDRINLPIQTEAILSQDLNVAFESMMTIQQHKMFNEKLNEALQQSLRLSKPTPRNPMSYNHTNEKDSFYELPLSELASLPLSVRNRIAQRKPKLRVTRNLKTGHITAQIIKIRIADLHVFSPRTPFDWRVSISAEVNWNGDIQRLIANSPQDAQRNAMPDRNKDRVSYKHQYCQIDLTQVKLSTNMDAFSATHELEVELDATMVRQHGMAAMRGQSQRYEELVRGFANNVRTLARIGG